MSRADAAEAALHLRPLLLPVLAVAGFGIRGPRPGAEADLRSARELLSSRVLQNLGGDWTLLSTIDASARFEDARYTKSSDAALERELAVLDAQDEAERLERQAASAARDGRSAGESSGVPRAEPAETDAPVFFGDWLLLGHEEPLTESEDLRGLISALAAARGPARF
jgi:hypothetical protein